MLDKFITERAMDFLCARFFYIPAVRFQQQAYKMPGMLCKTRFEGYEIQLA